MKRYLVAAVAALAVCAASAATARSHGGHVNGVRSLGGSHGADRGNRTRNGNPAWNSGYGNNARVQNYGYTQHQYRRDRHHLSRRGHRW